MKPISVTSLSALLAFGATGCPGEPQFGANPDGIGLECHPLRIEQTAATDSSTYDAAALSAAYTHPRGNPSTLIDTMMKCYVGELQGTQCNGIVVPSGTVPGCAVGIIHDFEIAYLGGYGKANIESNIDFGVGTISAIGSASKTITALAAMRMVEDGMLPLGDPNDANPGDDLPDPEQGFTLYELLSHKSLLPWMPGWSQQSFPGTACGGVNPLPGANHDETSNRLFCLLEQAFGLSLPNYVDDVGDPEYYPGVHPRLMAHFVRDLPQGPLDPPNAQCTPSGAYSNVGYTVAAAMVDRAAIYEYYDFLNSGNLDEEYPYHGYERYVWEKVLNPPQSNGLGTNDRTVAPMRSACVMTQWRKSAVESQMAKDYDNPADGNHATYDEDRGLGWGWEGPAGGWFMTIGDLTRLALRVVPEDADDSMISPATAAYMRTTHSRLEEPVCLRYGIGVSTISHQMPKEGGGTINAWFAAHDGSIGQYNSAYRIHPTEGYGVALMCNTPIGGSLSAKLTELLQFAKALQPTGNVLPYSPLGQLATGYSQQLYAEWQGYLSRARGDYATALANVQSDLQANPDGRQALAAVWAGDYELAARLMMKILDGRRR